LERIQTRALTLKRSALGDNDALLALLTEKRGLVRAVAKGVKSYKSKLRAATTLFSFGELELKKGAGELWTVCGAEVVFAFYNLGADVEKLSCASYIAELAAFAAQETDAEESEKLVALTLSAFHLLANAGRDPLLIKSAFELKLLDAAGMAPYVERCLLCESAQNLKSFSAEAGGVLCESCAQERPSRPIGADVLSAMRFVLASETKKSFSFRLGAGFTRELAAHTEAFLETHFDRKFESLAYLKGVLGETKT
jgi:DNA repair protein RecO (recombination protein O)